MERRRAGSVIPAGVTRQGGLVLSIWATHSRSASWKRSCVRRSMRGATQRLRRSRISVLLICARTRDQDGSADGCRKILRQSLGRAWSLAFHEHRSVPDGIIYPSRLNGHTNLAIFDRAISKLSAVRRAINWSTGPCHHHQRSSCEPRRHHLDQGHETQTGRTCQRWTSRCRAHEAANSALAA